jgi:hypothetical protein
MAIDPRLDLARTKPKSCKKAPALRCHLFYFPCLSFSEL